MYKTKLAGNSHGTMVQSIHTKTFLVGYGGATFLVSMATKLLFQ